MGQPSLRARVMIGTLGHLLPYDCLVSGLLLQPELLSCVLGPSEPEAGLKARLSPNRSSSCWQESAGAFCPSPSPPPRKTRSRLVCALGPGLPLSAPAASQHLGRGCSPDWPAGLSPLSTPAAHYRAGTGKPIPSGKPPSWPCLGIVSVLRLPRTRRWRVFHLGVP